MGLFAAVRNTIIVAVVGFGAWHLYQWWSEPAPPSHRPSRQALVARATDRLAEELRTWTDGRVDVMTVPAPAGRSLALGLADLWPGATFVSTAGDVAGPTLRIERAEFREGDAAESLEVAWALDLGTERRVASEFVVDRPAEGVRSWTLAWGDVVHDWPGAVRGLGWLAVVGLAMALGTRTWRALLHRESNPTNAILWLSLSGTATLLAWTLTGWGTTAGALSLTATAAVLSTVGIYWYLVVLDRVRA